MSINVMIFQVPSEISIGNSRTKPGKKKKKRKRTKIDMLIPIVRSLKSAKLHLEHVHFSSRSIFRAQGTEAYTKNASAGLLNAYSRTLALSSKVGGGNGDGAEYGDGRVTVWVVRVAAWVVRMARGVHEVRGTVQRVETKGEEREKRWRRGPSEGRGHGVSATRCYKGGYAAKSPQWAPRRLRRRIVWDGRSVIVGNTRRSQLSLKNDCAVFLCLIFGSVRLEEKISRETGKFLRTKTSTCNLVSHR